MNQNRIDKIGVAAVVDYFCRMGHIDPHIAFDDKVPVWDGNIDVHKAKDSCSKDDILFNMYVQVKSSEQTSSNFNAETSQPIEVGDLKLYKIQGCTLLIKVLINKKKSQIYFAYLSKTKINKYLEDITETSKTKTIKLEKAPKEYKDLFAKLNSMHLQSTHSLIGMDKLKNRSDWSLHFSAGPVNNGTSVEEWLAHNAVDILVKLPESEELFYLEEGPSYLFSEREIQKPVSIEGVNYFDSFKVGTTKEGYKLSFGNFFTSTDNTFDDKGNHHFANVNIRPDSQYVDEYLNQLKFILAFDKYKYFCLDGNKIGSTQAGLDCETKKAIESDVKFWSLALDFFKIVGINPHFNRKELSNEDISELEFLINVFQQKIPHPSTKIKTPISMFKIGKYNLCFAAREISKGNFELVDINACCSSKECQNDNKWYNFPIFSYLFSDKIFPDNLKYENIVDVYSQFFTEEMLKEEYLRLANFDALALISEFDRTGNKRLIDAADNLLEWIQSVTLDGDVKEIYALNRLQIKKRLNQRFTEDDKTFLLEIIRERTIPISFCVYVLLDIKSKAQQLWSKLSDSEKKEIKEYPIYFLFEQLIAQNINGQTENAKP